MAEQRKKYTLELLEAPDLSSTYILGFEKKLCLSLLSSYIFNLVLHGIKSSRSDFQRFCKHLEAGLKPEHDREGLVPTIVSNCIDKDLTVSTSLNWCLDYISQYCDPRLEVNLWTIAEKISNNVPFEKTCKMFSEMFRVEVRIIRKGQKTEIYPVNAVGRFMIVRIFCNVDQFYLPFTQEIDLMLDEYSDDERNLANLDNLFNDEPFVSEKEVHQEMKVDENVMLEPFKLDRELKFSNRSPIKYLNIDPQVKEELEIEYFSAVKISENYNQMRAFAYQFTEYLLTHSNDEFASAIKKSLAERITLNGMPLPKSFQIYDINHSTIFNLCMELMTEAVKMPEFFQEIVEFRIEADQEEGFNTLRTLAKMLGIELTIIYQENNTFTRVKFYPQTNIFLPEFHFLGIRQNNVHYKVFVLNTKRESKLEGFEIATQSKNIKKSLIKDQIQVHNKQSTKEYKDIQILNLKSEFFESVAMTQGIILKDYFDCISNNIPCAVVENISENITRLKILKFELEKNEINMNFDKFQVFSYSSQNSNVTCHICNQIMHSNQKIFYSSEGCVFHFECMDNWFQQWYASFEANKTKLADINLSCPKCQKFVSIFSFLKLPEKKDHFVIVKASVEGKMKCCSCENEITLNDQQKLLIANKIPIHCTKCIVKIMYLQNCQICGQGLQNVVTPEQPILKCDTCGFYSHVQNFSYSETRSDAKCKKCWMRELLDCLELNPGNADEICNNVVGLNYAIDCIGCQTRNYKSITGKICPTQNCPGACVNCFDANNCINCSAQMVYTSNPWP